MVSGPTAAMASLFKKKTVDGEWGARQPAPGGGPHRSLSAARSGCPQLSYGPGRGVGPGLGSWGAEAQG